MRRAWQRVFASVDQPSTETDHGPLVDLEHALSAATEDTSLSTLGLSPRVLDALARLGAQTIGELLRDRKSTRLNSSHSQISYAVFCLKKKKISKYIRS